MKKLLCLMLGVLLSGCVPSYQDYYKLDAQYLQKRQTETRRFEAKNEEKMLEAAAQLLQDLGFTLEESELKLGLITGSKDREVTSTGTRVLLTALAAFSKTQISYDTNQKIYVTLVSTKSADKKGYNVRVKFARLVWDNNGNVKGQEITDSAVYQEFFDKLSQSLFLTANGI